MDLRDRYRGCLCGLAVGDALGATNMSQSRWTLEPIDDMVGGGVFDLQPGQWTDDTSMALCLAASLVELDGFDARDQMERYWRWVETGYMSSTGYSFDKGRTVMASLQRYRQTDDPYAGSSDPNTAGNGCIMRLAPIPLFYFPDLEATEHYAVESSRTTHGTRECLDACRLLARIIHRALQGLPKEEVVLGDRDTFEGAEKIVAIARGEYWNKSNPEIRSTGYVVDTLEAALWCFVHADSFRDAVLAAANLGWDSDTAAAVCGQIAGAYWGIGQIPSSWLSKLALGETITALADRLYEASMQRM
ncbi:MAG: ADP-ribosylglycohydrolase family protein [Chlorobi bacterium]|nr:ADP-ribosylglycohydrolase family protein [Chlorobiota bacterium]